MPPKSRRNRRNISKNRPVVKTPAAATAPVIPPAVTHPEKQVRSSYSASSPAPKPLSYPYITGEIVRIASVTALIILLLVIAALFLR